MNLRRRLSARRRAGTAWAKVDGARCAYRMVIWTVERPISSLIVRIGTPAIASWDGKRLSHGGFLLAPDLNSSETPGKHADPGRP